MTPARLDVPSLVVGIAVLVLGALLLLDRLDVLQLRLCVIVPAFLAASGAILRAWGLDSRETTEASRA